MSDRYSPASYDYYQTHPPQGDISVVEDVIKPGIREAEGEFGIYFTELEWGDTPVNTGKAPFVLAGPLPYVRSEWQGVSNPLELGNITGDHLRKLGEITGIKLNVVSTYRSQGSTYAPLLLADLTLRGASDWGIDVPSRDKVVGMNSIYPDNIFILAGGQPVITNSPADIADNIRCETFRLAYIDVRDESPEAAQDLATARQEASDTITELTTTIRERKLWHRAPTDGAIFIKTSRGWLSSQTDSDKSIIEPERFSLIRSFDPATNTIVSTGENPPSSDAPEFLVALAGSSDEAQLAVHFHSNGLTRKSQNSVVEAHRTRDVIRYGRFSSAAAVIEAMQEAGDNWIILKEHGVFWAGVDLAKFNSFVSSRTIAPEHELGIDR